MIEWQKNALTRHLRLLILVAFSLTLVGMMISKLVSVWTLFEYIQKTAPTSRRTYQELAETVLVSISKELQQLEHLSEIYVKNLDVPGFYLASMAAQQGRSNETANESTVAPTLPGSALPPSVNISTQAVDPTDLSSQQYYCLADNFTLCANYSPYEYHPWPEISAFYVNQSLTPSAFIPNYYVIYDSNQKLVADKQLVRTLFSIDQIITANNASYQLLCDYFDKSDPQYFAFYAAFNVDTVYGYNEEKLTQPLYYFVFPYPTFDEASIAQFDTRMFFFEFDSMIQAKNDSLNVSIAISNNS